MRRITESRGRRQANVHERWRRHDHCSASLHVDLLQKNDGPTSSKLKVAHSMQMPIFTSEGDKIKLNHRSVGDDATVHWQHRGQHLLRTHTHCTDDAIFCI